MRNDKLKNMIVLKNLPSNVVDEAIVILKPNIKVKSLENTKNNGVSKNTSNSKEYILNEAQMVISNYISNLEKPKKEKFKIDKKMEKECKKLKLMSIILVMLLVISFLLKM